MRSDDHPELLPEVIKRLTDKFGFVRQGSWLRKGKCPDCDKKELYVNADHPLVVRCGRVDKCGATRTVKSQFPELFDNWSDRYVADDVNPTAAADAYLTLARGLNLTKLGRCYTQELYSDRKLGISTATVRFALPGGGWWERFIDQPHRFENKANFAYGSTYQGEWWQPPSLPDNALVAATEIRITEGIFDAQPWNERGHPAVSVMTCYNYPESALARLAALCGSGPRPRLVWAFDANAAGRDYAATFARRAAAEGWRCAIDLTAEKLTAQPIDWNDLHLLDAEERPTFGPAQLEEYRWNGDVLLAPAATDKARLITIRRRWSRFTLEHGSRTWWAEVNEKAVAETIATMDTDAMTKALPADLKRDQALDGALAVSEIANCLIEPLYFEHHPIKDEGTYYLRFAFADKRRSIKATVSPAAITAAPDFIKRLAGISPRILFDGTTPNLTALRRQWTHIRHVKSTYLTGYVKEFAAYIFPKHAVHGGKVYRLNAEDFFEIGDLFVKPAITTELLEIDWDSTRYDATWVAPFYATFGPRGLVALTYFFGTLFAEQIRGPLQSWPFLEIVGEANAGKSTLIEYLWKLLGKTDYEGFDPVKSSGPGRARNMGKVGNLPVVLIEADRSNVDDRNHSKQFDWDEFKTAFNGGILRSRGVANDGMDTFEPNFRGGLVIAQNAAVNADEAILSRIVSLTFTKAMHTEASAQAIKTLHAFRPEKLSGFIIEAVRREPDILPLVYQRFEVHEAQLGAKPWARHTRLVKCHAQLLASLDGLATVVPVPDDMCVATAAYIYRMCEERHVAIAADHPMVQDFWEKVEYLRGFEEEGIAGTWIDHSRDPNQISVSLVQFEERCAHRRLQVPNMVELKRHLKTSRYPKFIAAKTVNSRFKRDRSGKDYTLQCWVFQRTTPAAKD